MPLVLDDAENVRRSRRPNLSTVELIARTRALGGGSFAGALVGGD